MHTFTIVSVLLLSQVSMASGWLCSGEGWRAKLINSTTSTRVPSVFVVSEANLGTVLVARKEEISKRNLSNGVRYSASGEDFSAILFVQYKEGSDEPLESGEEVFGKLIVNHGENESFDMACKRHLRN